MLTKPGIIFGNIITAIAGFTLASQGISNRWLFLATLAGLALVIASACVWNNYLDRAMDEKMQRTRNRALASGAISVQRALFFGMSLGFLGICILACGTNLLATTLAACGFFVYVVIYGLSKYRTSQATLIGSIAGAIPPVVGYTAVSGKIDMAALILFSMVVLWQMPHFFAIAMYRLDDYTKASIPVLPIIKGAFTAKVHMLLYVIAFAYATSLLTLFGYAGDSFLAVSLLLSFAWIFLSLQGFRTGVDDKQWARKMFMMSLVVIMGVSIMIAID
jgi:protoheme IX farnesyltransferase